MPADAEYVWSGNHLPVREVTWEEDMESSGKRKKVQGTGATENVAQNQPSFHM